MRPKYYSAWIRVGFPFTWTVRACGGTRRKLVDLTDDLCIFCHHHINHNHSCCVQAFSPLLSRFPRCWVWCSSSEMNPCFQTSISFTSSPFITLTPDPIPPFPKCSPLLHPKFGTLFSSSSPVIFSSVGFSCPTFSGAHELTFSTFTVFLAGAALK